MREKFENGTKENEMNEMQNCMAYSEINQQMYTQKHLNYIRYALYVHMFKKKKKMAFYISIRKCIVYSICKNLIFFQTKIVHKKNIDTFV